MIFYHATFGCFIEQIKKEGIKPHKMLSHAVWEDCEGGYVYFTANYEMACE